MITTLIISGVPLGKPAISGYSSIREAVSSLAERWPIIVCEREQFAILSDYDGCILVLEDAPVPAPASPTSY